MLAHRSPSGGVARVQRASIKVVAVHRIRGAGVIHANLGFAWIVRRA